MYRLSKIGDLMKGALNLSISVVILLVLGVLVLLLMFGFVEGSRTTAEDVGSQNDLFNCCRKYLANGCTDDTVECSPGLTIRSLASELSVQDLDSFCGC